MKMKMFTMLCALSLGTTAAFAQKGVEDGSRFGHGAQHRHQRCADDGL